MVIKCLCFDGVKNSENCTFRFRKLYVSFLRLYCHQKHEDVIKRKPGKLTESHNGLADLIRKKHDKKGYR